MTELKSQFISAEFSPPGAFLVTGGTRGIGRAISVEFARAGAYVIANYLRNEKAASELQAQAEAEKFQLDFCRADLTTADGLQKVATAVGQLGRPFLGLVHCAAIGAHKPVAELTARHFEWTMALNVRSFFELVKLLLPNLVVGSSIVALSSPGASRAIPNYAVVGASKGALESLARYLAIELAPRGIRTNVLAPGAVATDAWKVIPGGEIKLGEAAKRSPLGRLITPEEVARAALFLCSPAATGINGHTLIVDGGASIASWC
ncbi:MAG: SDR family oxidoreductase [Verrucomicrobia bacterium]|nr:SDR family oxidoreductase [Verrucomicrobiota bacterium]MBV8483222.1 SDR family oxidoreductase [Verrucomicrobiota bacterium]